MIRLLDKNDIGILDDKYKVNLLAFKNYFLNDDNSFYNCFGCFTDNKLRAFFCTIDSLEIPAWILSKNNSFFNLKDLEDFFASLIDLKEKSNLFQFFTVLHLDELSKYSQIITRYQPYIEYKLMAGTLTGHENINHDILEYTTFDDNMLIVLWVLKNEYRIIKK